VVGIPRPWTTDGVAQSVIAADGDEVINAEPGEIFQDFGVRSFLSASWAFFKMSGDAGLADAARIGARGVEKSTAGTPGAIDDFFRERQEIVAVVVVLVANHFDQASPSVANADDFETFTERAKSNGADSGGSDPVHRRLR